MKISKKETIHLAEIKTLQLLKERGIRGWNMNDLAGRCCLSKDTLYRMIGSKEAWIQHVLISQVKANKSEIVQIILTPAGYECRLSQVIGCLAEFAGFLSSENVREVTEIYPDIEKVFIEECRKHEEEILTFIAAGIEERYFRPSLAPGFILELMNAILFYFAKLYNGPEAKINITLAINNLFRGIADV